MVMNLLIWFRTWILKIRTVSLMEKITKQRSRFEWLTLEEKLIFHCVADRCTPEETILYIVGEKFRNANHYSECKRLRLQPFEKLMMTKNMEGNADEWFAIAKQWRNEGKVKSERLHEFVKTLSSAKSRWPEIFSGETPYVRKYWEVHFNYVPAGVAYMCPATKPVAIFDNFSDATKYVEKHSNKDYWWHSFNLFEAEKNGAIPKWEVTPTPEQFKRIDKPGYVGYNSYDRTSANCIFATPHDSYVRWLDAVREGDIYRVNEVRNGYIYNHVIDVGSWCVRYVEHEEPIDNANPNANTPREYLVERCED
jgi:hypothetical protein